MYGDDKGVGPLESASRLNERTRYTDLHCHILPGFDDGAQDWDEALAMARNAVKSGALRVVATPHVMRGAYWPSPDDIRAKTSELRTRLADSGILLEVIAGSEVYLSANTAREYRSGRLLTIGNSGYLLVELPSRYLPSYSFRELLNLRSAGAGVILAHPERNRELWRRADVMRELRDAGVFFQVNAGSFAGAYGRQARAGAGLFLRGGLAHFVGSDAHSGRSAADSDIGADISGALSRISKLGPRGAKFLAAAEARVGGLLAGKLS